MYKLTQGLTPDALRHYGFKRAHELPEYDNWCDNSYWYDDMYLIPLDPDCPDSPYYADEDNELLLWKVHCMSDCRLWIDMVPSATYHIDNQDCEKMFAVLFKLISDKIIEDDYEEETLYEDADLAEEVCNNV